MTYPKTRPWSFPIPSGQAQDFSQVVRRVHDALQNHARKGQHEVIEPVQGWRVIVHPETRELVLATAPTYAFASHSGIRIIGYPLETDSHLARDAVVLRKDVVV